MMKSEDKEKSVKQEELDIKEINSEEDNTKVKKDKKKNPYYLFLSFFTQRLKEDKLYLMSFIITIIFVALFSIQKVHKADGIYNKKDDTKVVDKNVTPTVDKNLSTEDLDVSSYVGIYSKEYTLDKSVSINGSCDVDSYKIVYHIKKNKSIGKYFVNECIGTIEMWNSELSYVNTGGARYISANKVNYLFSVNSMKELDGDTYYIDGDIKSIKVKQKVKDIGVVFDSNKVIINTKDNLMLLNGSLVSFDLSSKYTNNGGDLAQRVFKSSNKNQYNFIVFENGEKNNCYNTSELVGANFIDTVMYKIYTIKYNDEDGKFNKETEIISRNKSAGCDVYDEDLKLLKK